MQADLVHINRATQLTEPALAKSWKISSDGLQYTLVLRQGLKFSDGQPLDADDVLFTFQRVPGRKCARATARSPDYRRKANRRPESGCANRRLSTGQNLRSGRKTFRRLGDSAKASCWKNPIRKASSAQIGTLATTANQWAGLGPFRLKEYVAGQRLVLERNPYYWKTDAKGNRLPYLDELVFLIRAERRRPGPEISIRRDGRRSANWERKTFPFYRVSRRATR